MQGIVQPRFRIMYVVYLGEISEILVDDLMRRRGRLVTGLEKDWGRLQVLI